MRRKARVIRASKPTPPAKKKKATKKVAKKKPKRRAVLTSHKEVQAAGISSSVHVAKYEGVCEACGQKFGAGAAIRWNGYTRKPRHADCSLMQDGAERALVEQGVPGEFELEWRYLLEEDIPPAGSVVRHPDLGGIEIVSIAAKKFVDEDRDWLVRLVCRAKERNYGNKRETMVGNR